MTDAYRRRIHITEPFRTPMPTRRILALLFLATSFLFTSIASAQSQASSPIAALKPVSQQSRIAPSADLGPRIQLSGHVPSWATPAQQSTQAVDLAAPAHITVMLTRAPAAEAALEQLLTAQQTPGSPFYHQWINPAQIGALYGPTQADIDAVTAWAAAQGLTLAQVRPDRVFLDFTGTLGAVASAFHTSFAYFNVGGETRLSSTSNPFIPQAFNAVISSIRGLSQTHLIPQSRMSLQPAGAHSLNAASADSFQPDYTASATEHFILPGDFNTIYDSASVLAGGDTGASIGSNAQKIAIIGRADVVAGDISNFESISGLAAKQPVTILAGTDPGTSNQDDAGEATLDTERVLSTAPGAEADLVIAKSTINEDGVDIATGYNIYTLKDPVMTISFGSCEASDGSTAATYYNTEFQSAAAEGMTVLISAGDSGAAGCDTSFATAPSSQVASINAICASSYVTCVGGTEFNDASNYSLYWSSQNSTTNNSSALSYIPEGAWNEPTTTNTNNQTVYQVAATGGGASAYISKPGWQTGTGVPADGHRDVPDVALSAADHDGYIGCFAAGGGDCVKYISIFSGTSAAAPGMAGIVALLNTKLGAAQGSINPLLYNLANGTSTASSFHDVTVASSGVSSCTASTPSMCNNSTPGPSGLTGGLAGYLVTAGYDQTTGLGSPDVAKLLSSAAATSTVATTLAVTTVTPNPALVNQSVTLTATLTPGASSHTPSGMVQFYANGSAIGSAVMLSGNAATLTYAFTSANTYAITAVYSGDANFATSTATAVSLTVNAATFSVTPAATTYSLVSGAATGNTDVITVTSLNSFAGTVALSCTVAATSGTAAGACALSSNSAVLTSGSSSPSTLTISTTPGTSGVLTVHVTGTSGGTTVTSAAITVTLTAASFTMSALPSTAAVSSGTSATSVITLTSVNGFAGTVSLTCAGSLAGGSSTTATTCSTNPASVTLTAGGTATTTATIPTTLGVGGVLTATITGSGVTTGATIAATSNATVAVTITAPSFTVTPTATSLSFTSGVTTGNTDVLTVTSVNGFAGSVNLSCSLSSGTAYYPPSCAVTPNSVTLTSGGTATATLSISSTTATTQFAKGTQSARLDRRWTISGSAFFAALFFIPALRRRRALRQLATLALLFCGIASLSGCGGSSSPAPSTPKSSAGTYTATITATGTTNGATNSYTATPLTITVTIN